MAIIQRGQGHLTLSKFCSNSLIFSYDLLSSSLIMTLELEFCSIFLFINDDPYFILVSSFSRPLKIIIALVSYYEALLSTIIVIVVTFSHNVFDLTCDLSSL
jgi:hypothetical protein